LARLVLRKRCRRTIRFGVLGVKPAPSELGFKRLFADLRLSKSNNQLLNQGNVLLIADVLNRSNKGHSNREARADAVESEVAPCAGNSGAALKQRGSRVLCESMSTAGSWFVVGRRSVVVQVCRVCSQ
jgi:hypothetical protein